MNETLRAHVTRVAFDLTLRKTQIAWLVILDLQEKEGRDPYRRNATPMERAFLVGIRGLYERGLVDQERTASYLGPHRLTTAGKHVVGLLQEAGIYQEYADAVRPLGAAS